MAHLNHLHLALIHSKHDGLLTLKQPQHFASWVNQSTEAHALSMTIHFDKVQEQHDAMLDGTTVPALMVDFVRQIQGKRTGEDSKSVKNAVIKSVSSNAENLNQMMMGMCAGTRGVER